MTSDLSESLVDLARQGDRSAQSRVLDRLQPMLRGYFVRRVGPIDDVDDLLQNTLVRISRGFADLKEVRSLRAFALKAALFELQDLYRGRYSARETRLDPDLPEPGVPPASEGLSIDLDRALATLTPTARRILELRSMGYRYEEIAGMIESTEAAVKMQVKRALDRLRDLLAVLAGWLVPGAFGA